MEDDWEQDKEKDRQCALEVARMQLMEARIKSATDLVCEFGGKSITPDASLNYAVQNAIGLLTGQYLFS